MGRIRPNKILYRSTKATHLIEVLQKLYICDPTTQSSAAKKVWLWALAAGTVAFASYSWRDSNSVGLNENGFWLGDRRARIVLKKMCVLFSISCDRKIDYASLARRARSDFVVTTRTGDWDLYFEALGKGAFDVIQSPCYSTHVEMTITRVLREEEARLEYRSSR